MTDHESVFRKYLLMDTFWGVLPKDEGLDVLSSSKAQKL